MARSGKSTTKKVTVEESGPTRVMVFVIESPNTSVSGPFILERPADGTDLDLNACIDEIERREAIARLMTEEERRIVKRSHRGLVNL